MKAVKVATAKLPSDYGSFTIIPFESDDKTKSAIALLFGSIGQAVDPVDPPLVRIHSQCLTGEAFSSTRCNCAAQLDFALDAIADAGCGVLIYDLQESTGIGAMNKLREYEMKDACGDTTTANHQLAFDGEEHRCEFISEILLYFGLKRIRLMSNNPSEPGVIKRAGIAIVECIPIEIAPTIDRQDSLPANRDNLSHLLTGV